MKHIKIVRSFKGTFGKWIILALKLGIPSLLIVRIRDIKVESKAEHLFS